MRHNREGRKLNRTASHRRALLSALSTALIKHKKITTTTAKAKETRRIIEPIITRARDAFLEEKKSGEVNVHARRVVAQFIRDKDAVKILFSEIAEKVGKRPGGYTRVLPLGNRLGDGSPMSIIELVDYNEAQDTKKRKARVERSKQAQARRKVVDEKKKDGASAAAPAAAAAAVEEAPVVDETPVADAPEAEEPQADAAAEEPKS